MTEDLNTADPVEFARKLIRCPSITPAEGGALDFLQTALEGAGFTCHRLVFSEPGTPDVDNLYARIGTESPHLCFAGHTDVVPPGDEHSWTHPPFGGEVSDGRLYGRGAADMKGGIACFLAAALRYLGGGSRNLRGSISFLITGDEEGPALNGTQKVLHWLKERGERLDHCLLGEPSNPAALGDAIKIGRRGSLNGVLTVSGRQGHVAYPELAANPVPGLLAVLNRFLAEPLDAGNAHFAPSNLEITSIDVGNDAENVIPARASAMFNIRFNDEHTAKSLEDHLRQIAGAALAGFDLRHSFSFRATGECFLTEPGLLVATLRDVVKEETGHTPELSTGGGTSDARFIKDTCPVVEFGLVNTTIHAVDEHVSVADLHGLTAIYERFLARYFEAFAESS